MSERLNVLIEGRPVGRLTRLRGGRLQFRYHDDYAGTPLSVSMPAALREHSDRRVRPWIAGLLPDNERVIERWAREFGTATSPFALLGTPIGEDCAGAVQFVRDERLDDLLARRGDVEWLTEAELAGRLRTLHRDPSAWLSPLTHGQFSLAGAQAKIALLRDGARWGVPSGARPTSHILKPAVSGLDDHDLNEHLCLAAAHAAGLLVARTRILRAEDQTAICVERYDRIEQDGALLRIHQEDSCQALSVEPGRKYQADGGPGAAEIAELMRNHMSPRAATANVWRLVDALAWNWLIAGTDAHAKNHSLLLSGDQVRLAPLYDVASALPYPHMDERDVRFAMKIGRDYAVFPRADPWPHTAVRCGVDAEELRERVLDMAGRCPDAFAQVAARPEVTALGSTLPGRLVTAVADRVRRCLRVMAAPAR